MLLGVMDISWLMSQAQHVEEDKLKKFPKYNKKAGTWNYEYSQHRSVNENQSQFKRWSIYQIPLSVYAPPPILDRIIRKRDHALYLKGFR